MSYILCTDLDRTLIPNGIQAHDPCSIPALHSLLDKIKLKLVYVSGRDINLVDQAIKQYRLPVPDFAITDVGSQIYQRNNTLWQINTRWQSVLQESWDNAKIENIKTKLCRLNGVRLQEPEKQSRLKSSYYFAAETDISELKKNILHIINRANFNANIVLSLDETSATGLLDIIPKEASKNSAIQFLINQESFDTDQLVFSGDSGNDMSVFSSQLNAILVNNAEPDIKKLAIKIGKENNVTNTIYLASGDFFGLTGNYCAGILEGMAYYFPEIKDTIQEQLNQLPTVNH